MSVMKYLIILISAVLVNNFVLSRFLGCCPFLGVSKKTETAVGMSGAVIFVMTVAAAVTWLIDKFLLALIVLCFFPGVICFIGIFYDLLYIVPTGIFGIALVTMIIHLFIIRHKINRNELVAINVNGFQAFIKMKKEN